ncbi:uncharacterized protein LOC135294007 isoform X2 [Passer domesticus]|uniref:uncharacterized protein LOC135294007 isoform X2 n=1 Tax=Passer domesticus TaxID=48849 RepID=UPI0030FEF9DF
MQTQLSRYCKHEETTRRTSRCCACDAEHEEAFLFLPAKQAKIAIGFPERPLKKEEILTAPATYSPSAQPRGTVPKESRLLFQLRKKNRFDFPATVNQHNTTLPTTDAAAATRIYTIWRQGSLLPSAPRKRRDTCNLPCREKARKGN